MNFQDLRKVEAYQFYLDVALRKASKKLDEKRDSLKASKLGKSKQLELMRVELVHEYLVDSLKKILVSFPTMDHLPMFYQQMIKNSIDFITLKQSLGALNWAKNKIKDMFKAYHARIRKTQDVRKVNEYRKEYIGRISSVMKQIKQPLLFLEESRRIMKAFPTIKTSIRTVSIVGFPNVGKTTLLFRLTGSKPEINYYPFTTKGINVSYIRDGKNKIQLLDTPGTLNRFEKMNAIEKQAFLAIKYVSDELVYVFDLTECYPLKDQIKLYKNLKLLKKPIIIYLSKTDILPKEKIESFEIKENIVTNAHKLKKILLKECS